MRPLFVALLSLAACGRVNSGKSLEYPATPEVELGRGFSSLSGDIRGDCVAPNRAPTQRGANRLIERVFHATSKEEILRAVGYSGGANFGIGGFGLNLGFESLNRNVHTASTTFAVVQIQLEARSEVLRQRALTKHALETLRRDGPGEFYTKCGDGFIAAIRQGGSFLGIVALDGVSDDDTRRLSGEAGVSFLGIGVRGGASNETRNFLQSHRARYYIIQEGGDPRGPTSLQKLESIDALLTRADRFKHAIVNGQAVATRLVVEPYQVTSNRPRNRTLWNLTEQRRFLDQLAIDYGALQKAEAELAEKIASNTCARKGDARKLESLHADYQQAVDNARRRAEDCVNDPQHGCKSRGLDVVDPDRHRKAMARCAAAPDIPKLGIIGTGASTPAPPPPKPGVDAPCRIWEFESVSVQVAPTKSNGAAWDGDGSPPETSLLLHLGDRKLSFPTRQGYSAGGAIVNGLVNTGTTVKASLMDRDAFFDDRIAVLSDSVPQTLEEGVWLLESGKTSVALLGHCIQ